MPMYFGQTDDYTVEKNRTGSMYKVEAPSITTDDINVTEEELWTYYLGGFPKRGVLFNCPSEIRSDTNPSCNLLRLPDGKILLKDYGGDAYNIYQFVMIKFGLTFRQALIRIHNDFKLGNREYLVREAKRVLKELKEERQFTDIQIKRRNWERRDKRYWGQFGISIPMLNDYNVCPIECCWSNGDLIKIQTMSYSFNFGKGIRKIYNPLEENYKWISNVPKSMYYGFDQLDPCGDLLIITKALKEVMLWRVLGFNAIAPQSECLIPKEMMEKLKKRFENIVIWYDNDKLGKIMQEQMEKTYGIKGYFTTSEKNITDFCEVYGVESTRELIKDMKIC